MSVTDDDRELAEIKKRKLQEMLKKISSSEKATGQEEPHIVEIDDKALEEALRRGENLILDLWAEWCAPCKKLEPIFEELAHQYKGTVRFYKLNVDHYPQVAMKYGVMGIPTTLFFKDGAPAGRLVGLLPKSIFMSKIHELYL
ncbi:MAG: thioredoxin [Thermoplasmata archaeon]|nr:thioredoxin [Thermoplasmata archaeon]